MERLDVPMGQVPVIPVNWGGDDGEARRKKFIEWITTEVEQSLQDRKPFDKLCDEALTLYLARRKRTDVGDDDSSLNVPLFMKYLRQNTARVIGPIWAAKDVITCFREGPGPQNDTAIIQRIANAAISTKRADFKNVMKDAFRKAETYGLCAVKVGYTWEYERIMRRLTIDELMMKLMEDPAFEQKVVAAAPDGAVVEEEILVNAGPFPETVPIKDYLWPWYAATRRGMPWEGTRSWLTPSQVKSYITRGLWNDVLGVSGDGSENLLGDPDKVAPKPFAEASGEKKETVVQNRHYQVCEVYCAYDVDGDGQEEEVIVWFELGKKVELKTVYNYYSEARRPIPIWCSDPTDDGLAGISLAFKIDPLQTARTGILNQRLDAGIRANDMPVLVKEGSDLARKTRANRLRHGITFTNANLETDIKVLETSYAFPGLENMEQDVDNEAMQLASLNPGNFGFKQEERPTKFGQGLQAEQSQIPLNDLTDSFSGFVAEVVSIMVARLLQFFPEGFPILTEGMAVEDQVELQQILTDKIAWPVGRITGNIGFRTTVSSATMDAEFRKKEKGAILEGLGEAIDKIGGLAVQATTPSPVAPVAEKLLALYTGVLRDYLKDSILSEDEVKLLDFTEEIKIGQAVAQVMQQAEQINTENEQLKAALKGMAGQPAEGQVP